MAKVLFRVRFLWSGCADGVASSARFALPQLLSLVFLFVVLAPLGRAMPSFAPAVKPGELTVRLRIQDGEKRYSARMRAVQVELDSGGRCDAPPCPKARQTLHLRSGRDATIRLPVPDWSAVLAIEVEGAEVLTAPGAKAEALADGSFLLVLEAKGKSKPLPP